MTAIDDALAGLRKIYNLGVPNDDELDELDRAFSELAALRAEREKLRKTICLDWDDKPTQLWELWDDNKKLRAEREKLRKTICLDWDDKQTQLWELWDDNKKLRAELDAANKAVDHARIVLGIYANPNNWKSHDGYMYLATMGHPWADARTWLTAHPAKSAGQDPKEQK